MRLSLLEAATNKDVTFNSLLVTLLNEVDLEKKIQGFFCDRNCLLECIIEEMREGNHVSKVVELVEKNPSAQDWYYLEDKSIFKPRPINTKQELLDFAKYTEDELSIRLWFEI